MYRALSLIALVLLVALSGCARGGVNPDVPEAVLDVTLRVAGTVRDNFYYFVAFDTDNDNGADFPVPVAAGPYWGNGWGTGAITYFLEYHNGQYNLFATNLNVTLSEATGGFQAVSGTVTGHDNGVLRLTVTGVSLGSATLGGAGTITGVNNASDQNAGVFSIQTDGAGDTVAGGVTWTPAADGSRALTIGEQAQLNALNAGGVALAANSLNAFGLALTIGPSAAATQTITIAQAVAAVNWTFTAASTGALTAGTATLNCNSQTPTLTPPIAGLQVRCGDMSASDAATIALQFSESATLIGPPYDSVTPTGGQLQATIDLADLGGHAVNNLSINFITTTELIFDPSIVDPQQHTYDGLGPLGNDAVLIYDPWQFLTINNADAFVHEGANDSTLNGPGTQADKDAVDIIDWSVSTRRLG